MLVTQLFWLALLVPGLALARLAAPDELESGLPGALAVSWLAALALLSPVAILGYLLRLPLQVLSLAVLASVAGGAWLVHRRGWWNELRRLLIAGAGLELALVAVDLVLGWRVGSFLGGGDELLHVARIRFLLDHGLSNLEPSVTGDHLLPTYHTNLLHALVASCAQLLPVDVLGAWVASLAWAKLAVLGGLHHLGWTLFRRSGAAWLFALAAYAPLAPLDYLVYPNKLAPHWLVPLVLAFGVRAVRGEHPASRAWWTPAAAIAAGSLVLGQVHALYAGHAGLLVAPTLAAGALVLAFRSPRPARGSSAHAHAGPARGSGSDRRSDPLRRDWRVPAAAALALLAGAPFALGARAAMEIRSESVVRDAPASPDSPADPEVPAVREAPAETHGFRWTGERLTSPPPSTIVRGGTLGWVLLLGGLVAALASRHRGRTVVVIAATATCLAVLLVPPLTEWAIERVGALSLSRLKAHLLLAPALLPAVAGAAWRPLSADWRLRLPAALLVTVASAALLGSPPPWDGPGYLRRALRPAAQRRAKLEELRSLRDFLRSAVPLGAVVLADFRDGQTLVMLADAHVLVGRGCSGVSDRRQRREDLARLLSTGLSWAERRELLRARDVGWILVSGRTQERWGWAVGHVADESFSPDRTWALLRLDLE